MTEAPQILLNHRLKSLRLPTVLREYGKLAKKVAAEGLDHVQFLARLIELEMIDRERRMIERATKAAKCPAVKSPPRQRDSFDFRAIPALNKMQVRELPRCKWPYGDASIAYRLTGRAGRDCHRPWPNRHRQVPHRPRPRANWLPKAPVRRFYHCRRTRP